MNTRSKSARRALAALALSGLASCATTTTTTTTTTNGRGASLSPAARAERFLAFYNGVLPEMSGRQNAAAWASSTDVSERNSGQRVGAEGVFAGFAGSSFVVTEARELLANASSLDDLTVRQLRFVLLDAAYAPGSNPTLAEQRIAAEAQQSERQDGFRYCLVPRGADGACASPATANEIDNGLRTERDLSRRLSLWTQSKEIGDGLRPGLLRLRELRNGVAREMGYPDFFSLQVADYGMTADEMMSLLDRSIGQVRPLFDRLHCYARARLATRYSATAPTDGTMPAHWLGNRWAQSWPTLVEAVDLDPLFASREPAWIVRTAEQYYVSMGFDPLPRSFWDRSDLYPVPAGQPRRKNSHASAWHVDLRDDVRSLMSVEANSRWFATAHHELGHIYYYRSYTRPEVPPVLRRGANRAFHEAIGELIAMSVMQEPYLRQVGVLPASTRLPAEQQLLDEAFDKGPVFFLWSAGTMSHFERDLYAGLPEGELNARWWRNVRDFQGVTPPSPRDETHCDACTKTHINDDPAQYYDYALATLIQFQLHEHLCRTIVRADPHACTYAGNRAVGDALRRILSAGAVRDWRSIMREVTGEDISAAAMLRYFAPLDAMLTRETAGQRCGWTR